MEKAEKAMQQQPVTENAGRPRADQALSSSAESAHAYIWGKGGVMKRLGKFIPGVALGGAMLVVVGCGASDIEVPARDVTALLNAAHDVRIPNGDIPRLADNAAVSTGTWRDAAQDVGKSHPWETITAGFKNIDENMGETTREVALKTACDMLFQKVNRQPVNAADDLAKNLPTPGPPYQETLEAAFDAYNVLSKDEADGNKKDEAAVSVTCFIANTEYNIMVHSGS